MTDALKTVLSGALSDSGLAVTPSNLNLITTALARRGVEVQGDGQREALQRLWSLEMQNAYTGPYRKAVIDVVAAFGLYEGAPSATAPETAPITPSDRSDVEAVAPVRKVVQIACDEAGISALCNDGTIWNSGFQKQAWFQMPPIPQPGAEL